MTDRTASDKFVTAYQSFPDGIKDSETGFYHAVGQINNRKEAVGSFFSDSDKGTKVRSPYDRSVYEYFRPNERIPTGNSQKELQNIMRLCRHAYDSVGVVRSVVDLMSEFAAEGVQIVHEDEIPNTFYQNWAKKVNLADRAERFANWLYKTGNVVVRRNVGILDGESLNKLRQIKDFSIVHSATVEIPISYIFYDPSRVDLVGEKLATFSEEKRYALSVPLSNFEDIHTRNPKIRDLIMQNVPDEIKKLFDKKNFTNNQMYGVSILLPSDKIFVGYYKKDDDEIWARSFIYAILGDIFYNNKLKTAKTAGLDGLINVVRLWKLGDHTMELLPSPVAGSKLAGILEQNVGGGSVDIIWDSAIKLEEFYPPIDKIIGVQENYQSILLGLGVPENLIGGLNKQSAAGNTTVGLKNLIKRIEAGRRVIKEWLEKEIDIIHNQMGFRKRPEIRFTHSDLHDERVYYNLLLQLVDRNILPDERILELLDEIPDFELSRVRQQEIERKTGDRPPKAGTFNNPQIETQHKHEIKLRKIQQESTNSNNETKRKLEERKSPNGRPPGSKDSQPRTRGPNKVEVPMGKLVIEANNIYNIIDKFVTDLMLNYWSVGSVRELTKERKTELELYKNQLFIQCVPFQEVTQDKIKEYFDNMDKDLYQNFDEEYKILLSEASVEGIISLEDRKMLKLIAYSRVWGD